jgi:hypothetical protein
MTFRSADPIGIVVTFYKNRPSWLVPPMVLMGLGIWAALAPNAVSGVIVAVLGFIAVFCLPAWRTRVKEITRPYK